MLLLWFNGQIFWFDLMEEISSQFKKYYDDGYSDRYLEAPYVSTYSKDPYWDALKNVWDMSMQQKVAWVEYVEEALAFRNCSLNQKKLWAILYYFVPEFRTEIARNMKMELGESSSNKFIFDQSTVLGYCREYYQNCVLFDWDWKNTYESLESLWETGSNTITANTPEDIMTNCQEFFVRTYNEWQSNEQRVQNLQTSQLWADKYWNSTTDDSPYDIMSDLSTQAELTFKEVERATTPVLYDLPVFAKSKDKIINERIQARNGAANNGWWSSNGWTRWSESNAWVSNGWTTSLWWNAGAGWGEWSVSLWWWTNTEPNWSASDAVAPLPSGSQWFSMEWRLDYLVEWLWANSVVRNNSLFYGSLCAEEEEEPEPEEEVVSNNNTTSRWSIQPWRDLSNLWSEELQTLVKNLEDAISKINKEPELKENHSIGSTSSSQSNPGAEQERMRQELVSCFDTCKDLRFDQKASCELMCACWERKSKIFDPELNPGLWPIVMLKYCTVPAVDMRFTVWGKEVFSLEEMINEIYWVVDKLSREWKLGIWTQQRNFLDSTTKMMKVVDSFAFSIDVEFVDIADQLPNYSTHYREFVADRENEKSLQNYWISSPLNNPATKNRFRIVWSRWESVRWYSTASNPDVNRQNLADLDVAPSAVVDLSEYSREERYAALSKLLHNWDDIQADFWQSSLSLINDMTSYAEALNAKRK